jgi:hypothetical protein
VDCGVVAEDIFAAIILSDKAKTLRIVKPLNCTASHVNTSFPNANGDMPSAAKASICLADET